MKLRNFYGLMVVIAIVAYTFVYASTANEQIKVARETSVYNRATACILSVPLATRTDEYIAECYTRAEQYNNVKVERFGKIKE